MFDTITQQDFICFVECMENCKFKNMSTPPNPQPLSPPPPQKVIWKETN